MLTPHQRDILTLARQNGGRVTKKEVVEMQGGRYFCNAEKHIGDTLARMVNARLLKRVKPGVYELGDGKKEKPATTPVEDNSLTLF